MELTELYLRKAVEGLEDTWLEPIKSRLNTAYVELCDKFGTSASRLFQVVDLAAMDSLASETSLTDEEAEETN